MVPSPNCVPLRGPVPTQRQEQLCLTQTKPSHVVVGAATTQGGDSVPLTVQNATAPVGGDAGHFPFIYS